MSITPPFSYPPPRPQVDARSSRHDWYRSVWGIHSTPKDNFGASPSAWASAPPPQPDAWAPVGAIPQRAFLVCADSLDPEIFVCALGGVCGREDHPERAHVRRLRRAQCHLFCRRVFVSSRQPSVARHHDRPAPDIRRCESTTPTRKVITTSWARSADSGVLCDSTSREAR